MSDGQIERIGRQIFSESSGELGHFIQPLRAAIECKITQIIVTTTFASSFVFKSPGEAIGFLKTVVVDRTKAKFDAFVVEIRWENGDRISGRFSDPKKAQDFLMQNV